VRAAAIEAVDAIAVIVEGFMNAIVERTVAAVLTNALTVERTILHVFGFHNHLTKIEIRIPAARPKHSESNHPHWPALYFRGL